MTTYKLNVKRDVDADELGNQLTFTTTIDTDTGTPINFDIEGTVTINGEVIPLGYASADFERVFAELLYWTKQVKNVTVNYVTEDWTK